MPMDKDEYKLENLAHRINQIYLDLRCGMPKIREMYNLEDVITELNELAGNRG